MQRFDELCFDELYEMTPADFEGHDNFEDALVAYEQKTGFVCVHIHVDCISTPSRVFIYLEPEKSKPREADYATF